VRQINSTPAAVALLLAAMLSTQVGASVAKGIFPIVGPAGATFLRVSFAAVFLLLLWRPWRQKYSRQQWQTALLYGTALGLMNLTFYISISRLPLGITVAIEFIGPLGLAIFLSRSRWDFLWATLAALGIFLMLPFSQLEKPLDPVGVCYALFAGLCWALYIQFGKWTTNVFPQGIGIALGMSIAALITAPFGIFAAQENLLRQNIVVPALLLALLSSALPYSLEMVALKKLPTQTFGILMSLAPALSAVSGFFLLHEALPWHQVAAIVCIVGASLGTSMTSGSPA
jgi:inner membrane transporter RhtA